jgi:sarcosine oxidase subunit beta
MGASIAFYLAKRKAGKIVVVDKGHVGQGGSGRSSALIRMHYSYPPEVQLAVVSLSMFEHWADAVGGEGDFRRTGFVRIVHPGESERLKRNVAMQRGLGVKVELIDRAQLKHLEPDWAVDKVDLAAYEPDSGYGDGAGAANDFLARARDLRVMYLSKTESSLRIEAERVRGISTSQGEIAAPIVVAATGPWTRLLFQKAGLDLPIETEYHQVAILKNAPDMKGGGCACIRLRHGNLLSLRCSGQISGGRFLRSARRGSGQFSPAGCGSRAGGNYRAGMPPCSQARECGSHARSHGRL